MSCNIPIANIVCGYEHIVVFRQGSKWVVAPFTEEAAAENHANYLKDNWPCDQVHILRSNS